MEDLIQVQNNKIVTTSLLIAEKFNKRHDNILRDIETLQQQLNSLLTFEETPRIEQLSNLPSFGETPYIEKSVYFNEQNQQFYPMYYLDRDAFTLLVMGFNNTNEKVLEWKLKYIDAFNKMEEQLHNLSNTPQLPTFDERERVAKLIIKSTKHQIQALKELYPDFFHAPGSMLELASDRNSSYANWLVEYNIDREYILDFPTDDIYKNYQRYCTENHYHNTYGKKTFYKAISDDFHLNKKQLGDGKRYFYA